VSKPRGGEAEPGDDRERERAVAVHQRDVAAQGFAEDETEQSPEQQRSTQARATTKARQRRPVEAG